MPGVVIRGGVTGHQDVVHFDNAGNTRNQYLMFGNISSAALGYECTAPGFVGGIIVRVSEPVAADVWILISKNGVAFFSTKLDSGEEKIEESFDSDEHVFDSLDELDCQISGGIAKNISVELKLM